VILVPKETNVACFNCRMCSLTSPHAHSHRVILSSGCEYLRALFRSGMQERYVTVTLSSHNFSLAYIVNVCWWVY